MTFPKIKVYIGQETKKCTRGCGIEDFEIHGYHGKSITVDRSVDIGIINFMLYLYNIYQPINIFSCDCKIVFWTSNFWKMITKHLILSFQGFFVPLQGVSLHPLSPTHQKTGIFRQNMPKLVLHIVNILNLKRVQIILNIEGGGGATYSSGTWLLGVILLECGNHLLLRACHLTW